MPGVENGLQVAVVAVSYLLLLILAFVAANIKFPSKTGNQEHVLTGKESKAADARARQLLRDMLEEREYAQLMTYGYLDVPSPHYQGRIYRIPFSRNKLVQVYEGGRVTNRLCLQPSAQLPLYDVILVHKLLIAADEQEYLVRANAFPPVHEDQ
ncbi:MAG: hypothetical protein ACLQUY_21870 [Ktedonobacterales bacterium]